MRLTGHNGVADGRLPTIGGAPSHGITGFIVECWLLGCGSRRRFSFDDLGLGDDVVFVQLPERCRFVCQRCKRRDVIVSADWPRPRMSLGNER